MMGGEICRFGGRSGDGDVGGDNGDDDWQVDLCKKRKFHEKFGGHHYFLR